MYEEMDIDVMLGFSDEELSSAIEFSVVEKTEETPEETPEETTEDFGMEQAVEPAPVEKKHRGITEVLVGLVKRA